MNLGSPMKSIRFIFLAIFFSQYSHAQNAFITTWKTSSPNEQITIPTIGGLTATDYDFQIDWGDSSSQYISGDNPNPSHVYTSADTFTVKITGSFPRIALIYSGRVNPKKLFSIEQWGNVAWESMAYAFYGASNMVLNATDAPDLSQVTDMNSMFFGSKVFNADLSSWNISNVKNMSNMFFDAQAFNGDLSSWNVSNVKNMSNMFTGAIAFNGDISKWNVSTATSMSWMFAGATSFNGDLSKWNVSQVTDMSGMFSSATMFNGDLSKWDVSHVNYMSWMFRNADAFKGDLSKWNVYQVTDMSWMFQDTDAFNQDLTKWNVSKVKNMNGMFSSASAFSGDLSKWNVSSGLDFREFLVGSDLSTYRYEQLLISWSSLDLQNNVEFDVGSVSYRTNASAVRQSIIDNYKWTIRDGGLAKNNVPAITRGLPNLILEEGFLDRQIDISNIFTDADGDPLLISAISSSKTVATAHIKNDTLVLTEGTKLGKIAINVIGDDGSGEKASISFTVSVVYNLFPTVINPIADLVLNEGFGAHNIDISNVFRDMGELTYTTNAIQTGIVNTIIKENTLILMEDSSGTTPIRIVARDRKGGEKATLFTFTINSKPTVINPVADLFLNRGFSNYAVNIANIFHDKETKNFTFQSKAYPAGILNTAISGETLLLTQLQPRVALITLTADDKMGGKVTTSFIVGVNMVTTVEASQEEKNPIIIYPNPTTGPVYINTLITASVKIYTSLGEVIFQQKEIPKGIHELDIQEKAGIYFVELVSTKGVQITKLVLE